MGKRIKQLPAVAAGITMEPLAVDTATAARLLGVSEHMVSKLEKNGDIVKKKIGRRSLYPVASLKRFLEKE